MPTALQSEGPVVYLEHKLLADYWLEFLGSGGRKTVRYDVPQAGAKDRVSSPWRPAPIGQAQTVR